MKKLFLTIFTLLSFNYVYAICDISNLVGWTIIYSGKVTGYIDENGNEQESFEGCEYGRILIVDYSKQVTCQTYSYSYSYHPDIVILSKSSFATAFINDQRYDISL